MKKLLLITQDFPPDRGGIQTYCHELSRALLTLGVAVEIVCPEVAGSREVDRELSVRRVRAPGSWLAVPMAWRWRGLLRELRPDAVLFAQWQPSLFCAPTDVPVGCLVHGRELLTSVFEPVTPWLLPGVFSRFSAAFPVSAAIEQLLVARAAPAQVRRVAPGVDPVRFSPRSPARRRELRAQASIADDEVVLLGVGRLASRKNLAALIECLPSLPARARLVLAGEGPEAPALRAQVARLGLEARVSFLGAIDDAALPDVYALGDVFVLPGGGIALGRSDVEGFGIVFLEAAACGLPAVACRGGGVNDAVLEGQTGRLLRDPSELGSALAELIADAELRQRFGAAARARITAELTWEHTGRVIAGELGLL